jgi:hypothetical protein
LVQSLNDVLAQIQELARKQHLLEVSPINRSRTATHINGDLFNEIQTAVRMCVTDLDPLAKKLGQWKATEERKRWPNKVADALLMYVKSSDLKEIEVLVSKHVRGEQEINMMGRFANCQIATNPECALEHSWLVRHHQFLRNK